MSKYRALERHLKTSGQSRLTLMFSQIEKVLGEQLPESARRHAAWWSNNEGHVQATAWMNAGYRTEDDDLIGQKLTFAAIKTARVEAREKSTESHSIFGCMKGT